MGHRSEANQPTRGWFAPQKGGGRNGLGMGASSPFLLLLPLLPLSPPPVEGKRVGPNPTRTGVLVGLPSPWRPLVGRPPPPLLYIRGRGHPKGTTSLLLAVCGAPSKVTHLGHIVVVLRRSPAPITSSSPSPRRRADETLPRPQLDLEFVGRHRVERVQITEVPCVRYLTGWIAKMFYYINRVT